MTDQSSQDGNPLGNLTGVRFTFASTAYLARFAALLKPLGLTPARMLAVAHLRASPGIDQKSLSLKLDINEASMMSLVNKLEQHELVERRPGRNKRTNALFLTLSGERCLDRAMDLEARLAERVFGWMSGDERSSFERSIDGIRDRSVIDVAAAHDQGDDEPT